MACSRQEAIAADSENLCVVCCKDVDIYSVGVCDHPVCFECSTRMRVLCHQNECPICRGQMPQVIFSKELEPFSTLYSRFRHTEHQDRKYGLIFCSPDVRKAYQRLLEFRCTVCSESFNNKYVYSTFQQLKDHMRREHGLVYCELCVNNLKIFCFERRCYTKQELGYHRRKGDPDNTSHRGHPLCEFCDTRFMDSDELFRHLRRIHLFCHFCDADGHHHYYGTVEDLRKHFRDDHYLCEEGECRNVPQLGVFRTDIDLKAHIATDHSRYMSKSATKQARTLEVKFTLSPRPKPDRNKRQTMARVYEEEGAVGYDMDSGGPGGGFRQTTSLTPRDFPALGNASTVALPSRPLSSVNYYPKVNPFSRDDFPSLGNSRPPAVTITRTSRGGQQNLKKNVENFPRLGSSSAGTSSGAVHLSVNNGQISTPKVSIHLNHDGEALTATTHITPSDPTPSTSDFNVHQRPVEPFPALGKSTVPIQPQWVQQKSRRQESKSARIAPAPQLPPSDLSQFPSLSKNNKGETKKPKKSSSVTVPISNNWVNNVNSKDKQSVAGKLSKDSEATTKAKETKYLENKTADTADNNKSKNVKKQKKKSNGTAATNNNNNTISAFDRSNSTENEIKTDKSKMAVDPNKNGVVKKRSELKIGSLTLDDDGDGAKPPPGFPSKPPPGFNQAFPGLSVSNDLTFTNSSGQSYSINPADYNQPVNFHARNLSLIAHCIDLVGDEKINEFKSYSALFRDGSMPAKNYYEHCGTVLGPHFENVFAELLVLLPDIDKQGELYRLYNGASKKNLVMCENCKQVIYKRELTEHYNYHSLQSQFPSLLRSTTENTNEWKNWRK